MNNIYQEVKVIYVYCDYILIVQPLRTRTYIHTYSGFLFGIITCDKYVNTCGKYGYVFFLAFV